MLWLCMAGLLHKQLRAENAGDLHSFQVYLRNDQYQLINAVSVHPLREDISEFVRYICNLNEFCARQVMKLVNEKRLSLGYSVADDDMVIDGLLEALYSSISASTFASSTDEYKYSDFRCTGGSQKLETSKLRNNHPGYHLNDRRSRVCHLRNVCFYRSDSQSSLPPVLIYFENPTFTGLGTLPDQVSFHSVSRLLMMSQLAAKNITAESSRNRFMSIHFANHTKGFPEGLIAPEDQDTVVFLDDNTWANYGHFLLDNVIPAFIAAETFNIEYSRMKLIYLSSCLHMLRVDPFMDNPYCYALGKRCTHQEYCMSLIFSLSHFFFDRQTIFLDTTDSDSSPLTCF